MNRLNLLFFAFLISFMYNFYSKSNTIFLQSLTFLFLFELIIVKIYNRLKKNQIDTNFTNNNLKFNTLIKIDPSINSKNPYITKDKHTKHIVSAYDAMAKRNEYLFRIKYLDNFLLQYLNDERDIVTVWTFINLIKFSLIKFSLIKFNLNLYNKYN